MKKYNKSVAAEVLGVSKKRLYRYLAQIEKHPDFVPYEHTPLDERVLLLTDWHLDQVRILMGEHEEIARLPQRAEPAPVVHRSQPKSEPDALAATEPIPPGWRTWASFVDAHGVHPRTAERLRPRYGRSGSYHLPSGTQVKWIIDREGEERCVTENRRMFKLEE